MNTASARSNTSGPHPFTLVPKQSDPSYFINVTLDMNLQKTYPSLLTADLAAAEGWYTKLLGRGPDHRPMPTLLHWELSEEGGRACRS